jgi:outer membrane protein
VKRQFVIWPALAMTAIAAMAQGQAAQKVGVINIQAALVSTKDGQKAASELEGKRAPKTKDLEKKQAEIRSLQESLNRGGNAMSEQAKAELVRNIDTRTKSFNRELEDAQAEWQQDQDRVLQDLGQKMMAVIDKYAKDNGFSLILDVSNPQTPVLYASNTIDVTKDIVDLYDKNAPTSAPGAAARPPAGGAGAGAPGGGAAPAGTNVAPPRQPVPVRPPATAPVKK